MAQGARNRWEIACTLKHPDEFEERARRSSAHGSLEWRPSEKPGERQRAWLITGEPSDSDEPGRQHPETKSRSGDAERSDPHELN